jgi:MYXO-CTERM domain-containing protein
MHCAMPTMPRSCASAATVLAAALVTTTAAAAPGDVLRSFSTPTAAPHHASYPLGLASDGQRVFVANIEEAYNPQSPFAIFVLSASDGALLDRIDYDASQQTLKDMTVVGDELWALNADRRRRRIDPDLHTNVPAYETLTTRMRGLAWDAGCHAMWELVEATGTLGAYNTFANPVPSSMIELRSGVDGQLLYSVDTKQQHDYWYSLAYDGCSLWSVDRDKRELVRIDPQNGAELERLATPSDKPIGITFGDGELLLSDNGTDRVYAIEIGPVGSCTPSLAPSSCLIDGIAPPPPPDEPPEEDESPMTEAPPPVESTPPAPGLDADEGDDPPAEPATSNADASCSLSAPDTDATRGWLWVLMVAALGTMRRRRGR